MRFIEYLDLIGGSKYRIELDEESMLFLGESTLHYLRTAPKVSPENELAALHLVGVLRGVRCGHYRPCHRVASKISKQLRRVCTEK